MPKKKIIVKTTHDIITPESAKEGDYESSEWLNEEGEEFNNIQDVVRHLRNEGVAEPSSSCFSIGTWYSSEGEMNPSDGSTEIVNFHIANATPSQEKEIFESLFPEKKIQCKAKLTKKVMM